jgi:hypothetical protein
MTGRHSSVSVYNNTEFLQLTKDTNFTGTTSNSYTDKEMWYKTSLPSVCSNNFNCINVLASTTDLLNPVFYLTVFSYNTHKIEYI